MRKTNRHKKNKLQKRIRRNHARKQERMRIRFKQKRKRRNKLLQGKNNNAIFTNASKISKELKPQ